MPPKGKRSTNGRVSLAKLETAVSGLEKHVKENKRDNEADHGKIFSLLERVNDKVGDVATTVANLSGRFDGNPTARVAAETSGKLSGLKAWLPTIIMILFALVMVGLQIRG